MFPDIRFEERVGVGAGLGFIFLPMATYYVAPFLLISQHVVLAPRVIAFAISIYTFGIFIIMSQTLRNISRCG